jgi:hypothetical protein
MFTEALHRDLMRLGLAPDKSLANVRKMPVQRPQNKAILQATRVVRFPEFYEKAVRVFGSIADAMRMIRDKDVVLFVQPNKSNAWLAALFVDFLKRAGMADLVPRIRLSEDAYASNAIVVFLDDGMYSGTQMVDFLSEFVPNIEQSLVIVGAPFVTRMALDKIHMELEAHSNRLASMILYSDVMELLGGKKPAIYFDHKVPDSWSTYSTYDRYLDPGAARPFYKNANWTPNRSLRERTHAPLNASAIPRARAVTIEYRPDQNTSDQNGRRQIISYDNLI